MSRTFEEEQQELIAMVEAGLDSYLPEAGDKEKVVAQAMRYSITNGGKRLRPVILLAACKAFGGTAADALPYAAAMEMIHTYSLIHDDLPAMDNDDYRRGKEACHKKFDEATAILAGDGLLNLAFETMNNQALKSENFEQVKRKVSAANVIGIAAGTKGMILGQAADIYWEEKKPSEADLIFINEHKTGALLAASFEAGAILGGADDSQAESCRKAGEKIGIAFQIRDDMLDYEGNLETMGKLSHSDEKKGKTTYYTILGKDECARRVEKLTDEAIALLSENGENSGFLIELARHLINRDK